jgi:prevent-host-death family protein
MDISVSKAKSQLTDLVRRAETGEEIVLTRRGHPVVRLAPITPKVDRASRYAAITRLIEEARSRPGPRTDATRSQDFLYDKDGMPR